MRSLLPPASRSGLALLPLLLLLLLMAGACMLKNQAEPSWQQAPTTNKPRIHVMIQFGDTTVLPDVAHVKAGGTVSWVNYSTQYKGSVVLPPGMRSAMDCPVRPDFMEMSGGGLQSIPIGGDDDDVDLPCPLKAGTYDYQIYLYGASDLGAGGNIAAGMENPQVTMKGRIIVE